MALFCLGKEFAIISLMCLALLDQCSFKQKPQLLLQSSLETGSPAQCEELTGSAVWGGETKPCLQARACYFYIDMKNMSRFELSLINLAFQITLESVLK